MLHYNPRHVSSITMLIFRRSNFVITAPGIATICKRLYSMPVESRLLCVKFCVESYAGNIPLHTESHANTAEQSALNRHTVQPFTESGDTRCCNNKIWPPEDEHGNARNMSRII